MVFFGAKPLEYKPKSSVVLCKGSIHVMRDKFWIIPNAKIVFATLLFVLSKTRAKPMMSVCSFFKTRAGHIDDKCPSFLNRVCRDFVSLSPMQGKTQQ